MQEDFLSKVMDFDPTNLSAFNEVNTSETNRDPEIYVTNPVKLSVSEDGHYHSAIKILYNPFHIEESIVKRVQYAMRDHNGFFTAPSSLSVGNKKCPLFTAWKKLHFARNTDGSDNVALQEWGDKMYDKNESRWVLVQVIEDENQPELVGKFKFWKLPKSVWTKIDAKMHPSPESKKAPVPIMDYIFGPLLTIDVVPGPDDKANPERRNREISYDLCEFEQDSHPIINTDGTQLFSDEELEIIERYSAAKSILSTTKKVSEKKIADAKQEMKDLYNNIKEIYNKAILFMKENALNPEEKFAFKPWDDELTERVNAWIEKVARMEDPSQPPVNQSTINVIEKSKTASVEDFLQDNEEDDTEEDLPF